ncbi:AAA family ATPase [Robertmurraya korlensis]|uniref:AAA family ATPase n=1 Tax=Robertmurraya korlensis TaxID=519977 RepID=UPI000826CE8E|nr:AAA family ATPase [Robertmurraya korlensis]
MEQQLDLHTLTPDAIDRWETELRENGVLEDETRIIHAIHSLDKQKDAILLSQLLSMASLSRAAKYGQEDHLSLLWMSKAHELHSSNQRASEFLAQFEWKKKKSILDSLKFPIMRETDNRAAKKKVAEDIIAICQRFLSASDEQMDELETGYQLAYRNQTGELVSIYRSLIDTLVEVQEVVGVMLKAAEEYDESISGVFHTAVHFQELKGSLQELDRLKEKWEELFGEDDTVKQKQYSLDTLHEMIGMDKVKERVTQLYEFLKYQKERKKQGYQSKDEQSLHMVLTGNPGTGKTTLVRLLAKIYHELGILPREEVIETDRTRLVGAFVGQTEENVRQAVEQAIGGVLFIDEAYSLKREGQTGNDYGQVAIDTLVSLMTGKEYGGKFAVVLAGYPEEMRQFLHSNTGLRSRFPRSNHIHLDNYSTEELLMIAEKFAQDNDYLLTPDAKKELEHRIDMERVDDTFGNARTVQTLVLDAIFKKGSKKQAERSVLDFTVLDRNDFASDSEQDEKQAEELLDSLVGLDHVKDEVEKLVSFVKVQKMRLRSGLPILPVQLHSVFTGNPGTGKTTVAKVFSKALKEIGYLKRGHLIVTSRADFVAGYVGQTAAKTKKKIREALGGVLFIDEAYSLLSKSPGDFGKEAIDTLVDEMTKHNENLVVILAGYPNEMKQLLESNPGLQSRFKKFFHFHDYKIDELIEIMVSYATSYHYILEPDALTYLNEELTGLPVSGNGRFATNVIDEAIQVQALRISKEKVSDLSLLNKEDIRMALHKVGKGES